MSCITAIIRSTALTSIRRQILTSSHCIHSCVKQHSHMDASRIHRHHLLTVPPVFTPFSCVRTYAKDKGSKDKKSKTGKPRIPLTDDDMMPIVDVREMRGDFEAITNSLRDAYINTLSIRSGTGIEEMLVEFDGREYPLKELATISRKTANSLIINLSSMPDAVKPVMGAINSSGMNVNPQQEGTVIYLSLPRVTREHREILAKNAKTLFNKAKEELARSMSKYVRQANDVKMQPGVSADLVNNTIDNIRFLEKEAVAVCEQHLNTKTKELLGE